MQEEQPIKQPKLKLSTYARSWKQFADRAMEIIIQNPTTSRYVLKYISQKNIFKIKVTDGHKIVMKKVNASKQYEQIQKFTNIAAKALTNEEQQAEKESIEKSQKQKKKNKKGKGKK